MFSRKTQITRVDSVAEDKITIYVESTRETLKKNLVTIG